jgi:predicted enzyme related to lactoylglutathione lyase
MASERTPCKIEWITIPSPELEKARDFYASVFGWSFQEYDPDFWVFQSGNLHGGMGRNMTPADGGIGFSITVEDIPSTLAEIASAGGTITKEKWAIGEGLGFCAEFRDPNGNKVELWSKT